VASALAFVNRAEWGSSHRHNLLGSLSTAFKWANSTQLIPHNPLASMKRPPKESRGSKAVVDERNHKRLLKTANSALRLFLTVLHETGARPSELARLKAQDVDFKNAVALLSEHKTAEKTGRPRMIVLTPSAVAILRKQAVKHPDGVLLRNARGGHWTKDGIGLAMRRACRKAGVKAIAYGYRHTFATDALANGVPDATVAALLGHSSTAMLHKHYSHLTARADVLRKAVNQVR
jgi:integrase